MLKIGIAPGEYITVGDDIKIVFSGGTGHHIHLLVDAPKDMRILRSSHSQNEEHKPYYAEKSLSKDHVNHLIRLQRREKQG